MELLNTHFQDFPIEFKEINPSDFPHFEVENNREKIIIEPNNEGFINEALQAHISLAHKNTVVVNAAVGNGKSFAIIKTMEQIYNEIPSSLIIVATPFVSLVEQYKNDILKDTTIPLEEIYDYTDLGRNPQITYLDKRIQVVTVNTLLGNHGEDAFKNSEAKREYLNNLIDKCKRDNTKVFFVYDEIHDAIQNFKEEFMFNLWKWKDVIHKNFIISATYNEASKVVIGYMAELTERKILIIEAKRIRFQHKQSSLHLHFSSEHNFTSTTEELVRVVEDALDKNRTIDILCYSKALSKSIIKSNDGIGKKLKDKFGDLNDCTSQLISNQRTENEAPKHRYDNKKCNIGTNFKTGVSIKKKKHTFVIIMPPRATRLWFRNKYGIFSGGINSVIQALARQRNKGEIHIILPRPDRFNFDSLNSTMNKEQIAEFSQWYSNIKHYREIDNEGNVIKPVGYLPLNTQDSLMKGFYQDVLEANVKEEIKHIARLDRQRSTRLLFPTYELFKLDKGEDFLANTFKFFGEDIAAYVAYSAFTNQFINCNLTEVNYKTTLFFEEGKIQENLNLYFERYFGEDYYNSYTSFSNFNMFYSSIRKELYRQFTLKYKKASSERWTTINEYSNKYFENQLLRFCGIMFYLGNYHHYEDFMTREVDIEYTRSTYFLDCIAIASNINLEQVNYSENDENKIKAYQNLAYFRDKLLQNLRRQTRGVGYNYLPIKPITGFFSEADLLKIEETISLLVEHDDFIKHDLFNFKRNVIGKLQRQKAISFYAVLLEDFFDTLDTGSDPKATINGRLRRIKPINSIKTLPIPSRIIDLLHPADLDEAFMNYLESDSHTDYNDIINSLLAQSNHKEVEEAEEAEE